MTIDKAIRPKRWKRREPEIRRELEKAKEQLAVFAHPVNRPDSESYYHYWRGVRNALLWVLYNMKPTRSHESWEI